MRNKDGRCQDCGGLIGHRADCRFNENRINESPLDIVELEADRLRWSIATFTEATAISSLRKCESEILEIEQALNEGKPDPTEYADALMCLLDSAGRAGVSVNEILEAFKRKTAINKQRTWRKNDDNSYSHV